MRPRSVGVGFSRRQSPRRAAFALAVALAPAVAGCGLDPSYSGTHFRCPPEAPDCPPGFTCVAGVCEAIGADARVDGADGPPDGPPDVCALAALAPDNDRCSGAIDLTAQARTAGGAVAYGDTTGYASDLNPSIIATCTGAPTPGVDAIYKVDANATEQLVLELAPVDWDAAIYVLDGCSTSASCLGGHDDIALGNVEQRTITVPSTGTYYIIVDSRVTGATGAGCFTLRARL